MVRRQGETQPKIGKGSEGTESSPSMAVSLRGPMTCLLDTTCMTKVQNKQFYLCPVSATTYID